MVIIYFRPCFYHQACGNYQYVSNPIPKNERDFAYLPGSWLC